jgi:hypothetical protein
VDYDLPGGWCDSYRAGVAGPVTDRVAIGVLTKKFPPELVDTVIDEASPAFMWVSGMLDAVCPGRHKHKSAE